MSDTRQRRRSAADTIAGVALILGIPALLALKAVFAGWYMAILVWVGGVFFVFGWTLAWIIAAQTFFSPHSAFAVTGATVRMRIAACVHAAA